MWCGSGISHSEASVGRVPARYCQLWVTPDPKWRNTLPYYKVIRKDPGEFGPILANLHQDMTISAGWLRETRSFTVKKQSYLYVLDGRVTGRDFVLERGDGAGITANFTADFSAHIILFEE